MNIKDENPFLCYKCQKIFHQECLKKWDKTRKLQNQALCCPICRNILPLEKWNIKIGYKEIRKQVAEYLNEESINNNIDNIINKMQQNKIRELMEEMKDMKEKYNKFIELTKEAYKNIIVQINKINPIKIEENLQNPQINDLSNSIIKNLELIYNSIQLKLKEMKIEKNKIKEENLKNKNIINEKKNENTKSISVIIRRKGNIENKYTFEPLNTIEFLIETVRKKESNVNNTVEIYYNNILITDYLGTLQDYKIENNSIIDFYDYKIGGQYFIKNVKGKTIAIDLEPSDTIQILKEKILSRSNSFR